MELKYAYSFDPAAQNNTAARVSELALTGGPRVLDIGSGPGWVSRYLAGEHGRQVTCLDYDADAIEALREAGLEAFEVDLEADDWASEIAGESFDVVILADVLEHLRDPARLLQRLIDDKLIAPDGYLVISIPNASHESVIAELAMGDFRYTETGILDETHIRWFTLESLRRLLEGSGFLVDRIHRTTRSLENVGHSERAMDLPPEFRKMLRSLQGESRTYQFVVRAHPCSDAHAVARQREQYDAERLEWFRERELLRRDLGRATELLEEERAQYRADVETGREQVTALQEQVRATEVALRKERRKQPAPPPTLTRKVWRRLPEPAKQAVRRMLRPGGRA